jgi:hypothetical protein
VTPLDTGLSPMSKVRSIRLCDGAGQRRDGGAGGIRTLDRALQPYNGLANRRLQPLGHSSMSADMPDAGASRKRQIQITRGRLEAPMLFAYASRTADILYRAFRRVFPGSAVLTTRRRARRSARRARDWIWPMGEFHRVFAHVPLSKSREIDSRSPADRFDSKHTITVPGRRAQAPVCLTPWMRFRPEIGLSTTVRRLFALLGRPAGGETPSRLLRMRRASSVVSIIGVKSAIADSTASPSIRRHTGVLAAAIGLLRCVHRPLRRQHDLF